MLTATTTQATARTVAYSGPLGRHLQKQGQQIQAADTLRAMRANVTELVADPCLFTDAERLRTNDSVYQTECVPQLQRWFRNVYRVYQQRTASVRLDFADGSTTHLSVAA